MRNASACNFGGMSVVDDRLLGAKYVEHPTLSFTGRRDGCQARGTLPYCFINRNSLRVRCSGSAKQNPVTLIEQSPCWATLSSKTP